MSEDITDVFFFISALYIFCGEHIFLPYFKKQSYKENIPWTK